MQQVQERQIQAEPSQMRVCVLGQIAGPIGGQSRLTQAYRDGRSGQTQFIEFWGHRGVMGPFRLLWQVLCALRFAVLGRVDAAYIAMSRTTFGMFRDLALLLPFILARVPVVAHVHGAEFDDFYLRGTRFRRVKALYLRNVAQFIFVNEVFVPRDWDFSSRATFIRNPIPQFAVNMLEHPPATKTQGRHRMCIGFISTFARDKGVEDFLDAADLFSDRADFVIAGGPSVQDDVYGNTILARIEASPDVTYLGYLSDPTPFYEQADLMIFPTNFASETSSLVVIEALASNTHPLVRRHNQLVNIFGDAPVSWFDDQDDLLAQIENVMALPRDVLGTWHDLARPWVAATFPTEAQWVSCVEAVVSEAVEQSRAVR